jgi:hypothetical protein
MGFFKVPIAGNNFIEEYVITITPPPGGGINLQNVEYILDGDTEGLINPWPFVGKYGDEHMYNSLYFKQAGVDNVRITSGLANSNYFLNNVLIGSNADNENGKLQVTGNITAIGNLGIGTTTPAVQLHTTGAVRFAGLTNDNTRTRVLVSDADGNLYYRDASSLVFSDGPSSSLAVNGTISAHRLQLSQTGWPDYVFAADYRLPVPDSLERYIRQNGHLPGIASAAEVEKKGIDVGENESALLKKIEELTLYLLRQEKTMREQAEEIKKLKQKNEQFADLNEQLQGMRKELTMLQSKLNK